MAKKRSKRGASRSSSQSSAVRSTPEKMKKVVRSIVMFLALFAVSFVLYSVTSAGFWNDLFFLLVLVFGFIALAFFIVWLVLLYLKASGK